MKKLSLNDSITMVKSIWSYSSVREVSVNNKCVAIFYRLIQLAILSYIIGYDIIWNRGYQMPEELASTVTTKIKGFGLGTSLNNISNFNFDNRYDIVSVINQELWKRNKLNFKILDS